jgi:hypothetical protein
LVQSLTYWERAFLFGITKKKVSTKTGISNLGGGYMRKKIKIPLILMTVCSIIYISSCASSVIASVPALEKRTLRLSREKPGFAEYQYRVCVAHFIWCTEYKMKKDFYDLKDPSVNNKLIDIGFVLVVKERR